NFVQLSDKQESRYLKTFASVPSADNMSIGNHYDIIEISTFTDTIEVPVHYEVVNIFSLNFADNNLHFTKEHQKLKLFSNFTDLVIAEITVEFNQEEI